MESLTRPEAADLLRRHGLRVSEPRLDIYLYLWENRSHPSAEQVYGALKDSHPSLSPTTVYSTLKAFAEGGLLVPLTIEDGQLRYDVNTSFHGHFKCRRCGRILDCKAPSLESVLAANPGLFIEAAHIDLYGLCETCRSTCRK